VCKESGNLNLECEFQVRGVVFLPFWLQLNNCAIPWIIAWSLSHFLHCCIEVSGFFQKPPGSSSRTARRHIRLVCCSCFGMDRLAAMNFCQAAHQWRVIVLVFGWIAWRRWVSPRRRDAVALVFAGVVLMLLCRDCYGFWNYCMWIVLDALLIWN